MGHLLFLLYFVVFAASSDVIDLDPSSFKSKVLESDLPFMVEFFAPWCGHCQRLAPEWEKAATNLKGIAPLGKVDCTTHQGLCQQYQVQGYPTIKVFSEKGKKINDYQQARQAGAIVRFVTDEIPNHVIRIKDLTSLASFLNENSAIPHLILFSSKGDTSPLIKSLSVSFKGRIAFGQVKQEVKDVVEKYNVESFPKIFVIKGLEDPIVYDGAISPEELHSFVAQHAGETVAPQEPTPPPRTRPAKPTTEVSFVEINLDNIEEVCQALCVIGFVDVETIDDKRTVKSEHQQVLDQVLSNFKSDRKFKFGWVDKVTESSLTQKFSLSSDEPALLVFNGKRQKYVKSQEFEFKTIFKTIEHVLTGDATYTSL